MRIQESWSRNHGTGFFAKWAQNQGKIDEASLAGSRRMIDFPAQAFRRAK
jgi:hypothetical protein